MITPVDSASVLPGCEIADVGAAAWEPGSGFADPNATAFAFAEAARRAGATIETGVEAMRVLTEGGRVAGVETGARADRHAGPSSWPGARGTAPPGPARAWTSASSPTASRSHLPLARGVRPPPSRRDRLHPLELVPPGGRPLDLIGVELGVGHDDPDHFREGVDEPYVALCREKLAARVPAFAGATMRGGWSGMVMMSPDGRPIIDQIPSAGRPAT